MKVTEQQMFRAVLVVGAAMLPVILLAVLVDPLAGAILFFAVAAVGLVRLGGWLREQRALRKRERASEAAAEAASSRAAEGE